MSKRNVFMKFLLISMICISNLLSAQTENNDSDSTEVSDDNKLVVVWTSGDKEVAMKMVFMYTFNAKKYGWWEDITLLIWGPSSKLLTEDKDLQDYIAKMKEAEINLLACKACADQYNIADKLENLGVTVRYTGKDLSDFIKNRHVVTF